MKFKKPTAKIEQLECLDIVLLSAKDDKNDGNTVSGGNVRDGDEAFFGGL